VTADRNEDGHGGADESEDTQWIYRFPEFEARLREQGALRVSDAIDAPIGGVIYHHRGVRVPAHEATFVWEPDEETFTIEVDAVGPRGAWARFEAAAAWDVFVAKRVDSTPYLAWMCDAEFDHDEALRAADKREAIALGRFSFGCYLHPPETWAQHQRRASLSDAPFFLHRPDGRTVVPDANVPLEAYEEAIPPELRGGHSPSYLGLVAAEVERE
jgi:hypothetical protein